MEQSFQAIYEAIKKDAENKSYTAKHIDPLYSAHENAKIVIVGQAPGIKAEQSKRFFNDKSGDRLRDWLGVTSDFFYSTDKLAILPMDFYYPGKGKSGDLSPRKDFASKWHPQLLKLMPNVEMTLLVGRYAQKYYLHQKNNITLTQTVKNFQTYLPTYFPIVHPSPLNQRWLKKNPWFSTEVLPILRQKVAEILQPEP
ncbi:MAG TPA: uracil-DNA glycosylase [Bavariicoccus seileri]|uniref:Uracil-DNA glycosylase n=1 Tax=Bavariicoccus seileri TaxID=549685 RepID=A0A3D4S3J7_9ENTE|nr:uracil-DNA glycosylase family protein [Bavariicoccus seileri]HCS93404.1 uracil-DNA glycosylase [Bavariicoccus seileri]